ncbi:hypothetical protein LSH36_265g00004 [Paralvinella palmiformis]|uniref:Uncharacterized protein n=1 Tax=Paralvinella palmiformis TaxID=53620 RepID=A0AAD9JLA7_9ANNE|nr:hypothetical protein LSH36_265g00004 [Paralvinella palmiformis]
MDIDVHDSSVDQDRQRHLLDQSERRENNESSGRGEVADGGRSPGLADERTDDGSPSCGELYDRCHRTFVNLGYCHEEEEETIADLLKELWKASEDLDEDRHRWQSYRGELERNKKAIHDEIDRRRDEMLRLVDEHSQSLHRRADVVLSARLEKVGSVLAETDSVRREFRRLASEESIGEQLTPSGVRRNLENMARMFEESSGEAPLWVPLVLLTPERPKSSSMASSFGRLDGGATGSGWLSGLAGSSANRLSGIAESERRELDDERNVKVESTTFEDQLPVDNQELVDTVLLRKPVVVKRFVGKTKKEHRDIGVTDVAVTSSGDVIIVDKHNKLVKMFTSEGEFLRFVGRKQVKAPSRITILSSGEILVTDNSSKSVKIFSADGATYVAEFADDLDQPISHCELFDGKIAIVDFSTCNIVIYERSGRAVHYFKTGLQCPAYVGGTRNGSIVVSDWRNSKVRIYDVVGKLITELDSDNHGIDTPYGVRGDIHGHLIVSEKSSAGIRIFTEDGTPLGHLSREEFEFKLPMALSVYGGELLVSVDYQGLVKIIKYTDTGRQIVSLADTNNKDTR